MEMDDRPLSKDDLDMIIAAMHRRAAERDEAQAEIDRILTEPLPVTKASRDERRWRLSECRARMAEAGKRMFAAIDAITATDWSTPKN